MTDDISTQIARVADFHKKSAEDIQWESAHRIGVAEYCPKTLEILLWALPNGRSYNIDLETDRDLIFWLRQVSDKNWSNSQVLGDLVRCWFRVSLQPSGSMRIPILDSSENAKE